MVINPYQDLHSTHPGPMTCRQEQPYSHTETPMHSASVYLTNYNNDIILLYINNIVRLHPPPKLLLWVQRCHTDMLTSLSGPSLQ